MVLRFTNVRTRLTVWYVLVLTVILFVYAGTFISLVFLNLRNNLDRQLEQDYEIIEDYITITPAGSVKIEPDNDPYFHERWFEIWSPGGKQLYASRPFTGQSLPVFSPKGEPGEGFIFHSLELSNQAWLRIMSGKINIEGNWLFIRLVQSEGRLWQELNNFLYLLILVLPVAIVVAGLGGYFLAKKFLAPIDQMVDKARKISEKNLQERLPVLNADDELGNLAKAFNELLERLQESFERLKQFTSDAAHELRTPLTAIRSIGEVGLQNRKDTDQYREIIGSILEENQRLTHLVDNLLFLSHADVQSFNVKLETIEFSALVQQTVDLILPLAEEKNQRIRLDGENNLQAEIDQTLLKQALLNLLDNAIKYSPDNSYIVVRLKSDYRYSIIIQVIDQGPGIPAEHQEKIFERFYRVDKGRAREMGGAGLGLAIAKWAVNALGGKIRVESQTGKGSIFTIVLPGH
jgi:heavy metal sensor kinase